MYTVKNNQETACKPARMFVVWLVIGNTSSNQSTKIIKFTQNNYNKKQTTFTNVEPSIFTYPSLHEFFLPLEIL